MFDAYQAASLWDNLPFLMETLTFQSQLTDGSQGTFYSYTLYEVRRKDLDKTENVSKNALAIQNVIFEVWQSSFTNAVPISGAPTPVPSPKAKDRFTDTNNIVFIIQSLDRSFTGPTVTNQALWSIKCQKAPGQ